MSLRAPKAKVLNALQGEMSDNLSWQTHMLLDKLDDLVESAKKIDMRIEKTLAARGEDHKLDLLQTIPGVYRIAAMTILLELGVDVSEFRSGQSLAKWAGMCPGNNESAGKLKSGKALHGNKYIRRILCEAANAAVRTDSVFKKNCGVIKVRLGHKKAVMAIGHKILRVIHRLLTTGKPYQDHAVDYEEMFVSKNAPRWIVKLSEYNLIEPKASPDLTP